MHLELSARHEAFRESVRAFLADALDADLRRSAARCTGVFQDYATSMRWHRIVHEQGWVAPAWPAAYGGPGWDLVQRYIWNTESTRAGAPALAPMGLGMCGPVLMGYGTEAQKAAYLPRILSGEDYWCQGYSEPGAGSDLASLQLRATRDGDAYVLNGTKIWTTHAQHANRMFCLVRTQTGGRPQSGITFLLLDMDTPGISVQPIVFVSGEHEVNTVFFDDVRVPVTNCVGAEHDGWTVAKYLLEFERGGGGAGRLTAGLQRLRRLAEQTPGATGAALLDEPAFAGRLHSLAVEIDAVAHTELRTMAALSQGQNPGAASSLLKTANARASQALAALAVDAIGPLAPADSGFASGKDADSMLPEMGFGASRRYMNYRALSIAGGTDEVQRGILARMVLGL